LAQAGLTSGWQPHPPATFFVRKMELVAEIIFLLAEPFFELLIELIGTLVVRLLFGE
jgi:hypothetical protein